MFTEALLIMLPKERIYQQPALGFPEHSSRKVKIYYGTGIKSFGFIWLPRHNRSNSETLLLVSNITPFQTSIAQGILGLGKIYSGATFNTLREGSYTRLINALSSRKWLTAKF